MADRLTILIIDDNPDDRENYVRMLKKIPDTSYRCLEAPESNEGLRLLDTDKTIDCVLIDYSLPGLNGLEVLKIIRMQNPFMPTILLTGHGNETIAVEAIKLGASDYVNKSALTLERLHHSIGLAVKQSHMQHKLVGITSQLQETNALKSAILNNTKHMIVATGIDGIVTVFNKAAEIASGYQAIDIVGRKDPTLWHDKKEIAEIAEKLTAELGGQVKADSDVFTKKATLYGADENEWTFVAENGARFPVNATVTPIRNDNQQIIGFLYVLEDITKRKEVERLKNDFISMVSHELRTPLTAIRGSLGLIVGAMAKELPPQILQLLTIAHNNSERLILLINDILDIDKIAAGEMRCDMKPESLSNLIICALDANRPYAEKFHTTLEYSPVNPEIHVSVDATRFMQTLTNLLSNASKFSPEGSTVKIYAKETGGRIRINVQDNGPGIAERSRPHIFEKFFQEDSSVTRKRGGSGLGLHIAKCMVEQMKGEIGFDTSEGKGTTFWIEYPIIHNQKELTNAG